MWDPSSSSSPIIINQQTYIVRTGLLGTFNCCSSKNFDPSKAQHKVTRDRFENLMKGINKKVGSRLILAKILFLLSVALQLVAAIGLVLFFFKYERQFSPLVFVILGSMLASILLFTLKLYPMKVAIDRINDYLEFMNRSEFLDKGIYWLFDAKTGDIILSLNLPGFKSGVFNPNDYSQDKTGEFNLKTQSYSYN